MMENILTAAKEDQELKGLLDKWSETSGEDLNAQLQANVDALLADLTGEGSDTAIVTSKVWVNADGKIVGREISAEDETGSIPVFTWKNPSQTGNSALLLEIGAEEETMTFTGTGQSAEGLLNGEYVFAVNGVKMLGVEQRIWKHTRRFRDTTMEGLVFLSLMPEQKKRLILWQLLDLI